MRPERDETLARSLFNLTYGKVKDAPKMRQPDGANITDAAGRESLPVSLSKWDIYWFSSCPPGRVAAAESEPTLNAGTKLRHCKGHAAGGILQVGDPLCPMAKGRHLPVSGTMVIAYN